jgi:RNA polymerase sigma factor (sigma-70 family)
MRNEVMISAREGLSMNQRQMAALIEVPFTVYCRLEKMDLKGMTNANAMFEHATKVAGFLGVSIDEIAPEVMRGQKVQNEQVRVVEVRPERLLGMGSYTKSLALPADEIVAERRDLAGAIKEVMSTLSYREREIAKLRWGLGDGYCYSLMEIAKIFKISRSRVQQLENDVLRKLQHPWRASRLLEAYTGRRSET